MIPGLADGVAMVSVRLVALNEEEAMATKKQSEEARQRRKAQGKAKRETVASVHAECERLRQALTVHQQRVVGDVARLHGVVSTPQADVATLRKQAAGLSVTTLDLGHDRDVIAGETRTLRLAATFWRRLRWLVLGR